MAHRCLPSIPTLSKQTQLPLLPPLPEPTQSPGRLRPQSRAHPLPAHHPFRRIPRTSPTTRTCPSRASRSYSRARRPPRIWRCRRGTGRPGRGCAPLQKPSSSTGPVQAPARGLSDRRATPLPTPTLTPTPHPIPTPKRRQGRGSSSSRSPITPRRPAPTTTRARS